MDVADIPIIDLNHFANRTEGLQAECKKVVDAFHDFGVIVLRDPRVNQEDNHVFLGQMEQYFEKTGPKFYAGEELEDAKPEFNYQTGVTPERKEKARNHCARMKEYAEEDRPQSECPPQYDAKWRFFWRMGKKPATDGIDNRIDPPKIIPEGFPNWENVMNKWGDKMLSACYDVAKMFALGRELEENTFSDRMEYGAHLLAPTASDLNKYDKGTVFAGYHYDLNFMTIHGKSKYPGLAIWTRGGKKVTVKVPDGCLLIQAGKQFEHLTGGYVLAGFHEVIYTDGTQAAVEKAKEENRPLWRISSTLFSHIRADSILEPLGGFDSEEAKETYKPIRCGDHILKELEGISLAPSKEE